MTNNGFYLVFYSQRPPTLTPNKNNIYNKKLYKNKNVYK